MPSALGGAIITAFFSSVFVVSGVILFTFGKWIPAKIVQGPIYDPKGVKVRT